MYFLNHRHFINKFVTIRTNFASEAGAPSPAPPQGASPLAINMFAQRARDSQAWSECRELFLDYMDALNNLAEDQEKQDLANAAELCASALYEKVRTIPRWRLNSLPSRALFWKPAEFMAWEWPGDDVNVLDFSNPSLLYMPAPPGWTNPDPPAAPVRRRSVVAAPAGGGPATTGTRTAAEGGAPAATGGAHAATGGAPAPTGGVPAPTGGGPAGRGGGGRGGGGRRSGGRRSGGRGGGPGAWGGHGGRGRFH